jgi:hypothetical protein
MTTLRIVGAVPEELQKQTDRVRVVAHYNDLALPENWTAAFKAGYVEGSAAREQKSAIAIFLRVARDEYAEGFRSAYYRRAPAASARNDGRAQPRSQELYLLPPVADRPKGHDEQMNNIIFSTENGTI